MSPLDEPAGAPSTPPAALSGFHPVVASWFSRSVGIPTDVQVRAWPVIASGSHALVSAPTGTGKTLAAFLWGLDGLVTGRLAGGKVRILYVSPLKALNNDIQRNLLSPLAGLGRAFEAAGASMPPVRVLTRSGDTPAADRRRMLSTPPEILITTPESLAIMLCSPSARLLFDGVAAVILDEIHAVAGSRRGSHLAANVERLAGIAGEFQRIALSATVKPLGAVADLVGGWRQEGAGPDAAWRRRPVTVVHCPLAKEYQLRVEFPAAGAAQRASTAPPGAPAPGEGAPDPVFEALSTRCRELIGEARSTLLFVNSRRHAEKVARFINAAADEPLAWAHHGSLSRELRLVVEQRLKAGELRAIVATSSLELGIDVGTLDGVVLVQTPFSVSSAVQRLGRAGHRAGETSRGILLPLHGKDIVDAAVMARCVREQDIEDVTPVECPLDVLAQHLVALTSAEARGVDDLFDEVRRAAPFHALSRRQFDLVLGMLAGRYEDTRLRMLSALVSWDRDAGTARAKDGARLRLLTGGGTIPDRGLFAMRAAGSGALLGELDEEFVWERKPGDAFVFGTQGWRIQSIDSRDVTVTPAPLHAGMSPFWKAEEVNRGFHLSDRIARALEAWDPEVGTPALEQRLRAAHGLDAAAAAAAAGFLEAQKEATRSALPHRHHLLVEHTRDPDGGENGATVILHAPWGGRVNRPFGLALAAAWEERHGYAPEMVQDNDALMLFLPDDAAAAEVLSLVSADALERLLRRRLEGSGFFGARFREAAGRALLLPRSTSRGRTPLWLTRQRAKDLYAAVARTDDFPLLLEAWRSCLRDEFDLPALRMLLGELADGTIRVTETSTPRPSPFCGTLTWKQTNTLMYADDTPPGAGGTSLAAGLVRELALSSELRPRVAPRLVRELEAKLQRTADGWAPRDARDLLDLLLERIAVPAAEWEALHAACARDGGADGDGLDAQLGGRVTVAPLGPGGEPCAAAAEARARVTRAREEGPAGLGGIVAEWLRSYGPVSTARVAAVFALPIPEAEGIVAELAREETVVVDRLLEDTEETLACDRENLERLLRMARAAARPAVSARPAAELPLFAARRHGLTAPGTGPAGLAHALEMLFGVALPARAWEEEVFPARLAGYLPRWLDELVAGSGLGWTGCGRQRLAFSFEQDRELFEDGAPVAGENGLAAALFPDPAGRYLFWDVAERARGLGMDSAAAAGALWDLAWRGRASADSMEAVRRGIANGFRAPDPQPRQGRRRPGLDRWQSSRPTGSLWRLLPRPGERDAMEEEEVSRDRVRQVLRRHGVVFRELLEAELPPLRWARLFRSLRLMEFSGEVVTGRFFEGIRGAQFALPSALEELSSGAGADAVWWINAADPASLCGIDIEGLKGTLPPRLPTTHVVFHGAGVVLVSRRRGRDLSVSAAPDAPRMGEYLSVFRALTGRAAAPLPAVHVETVNGVPVRDSPWKGALLASGFAEEVPGKLTLRARA